MFNVDLYYLGLIFNEWLSDLCLCGRPLGNQVALVLTRPLVGPLGHRVHVAKQRSCFILNYRSRPARSMTTNPELLWLIQRQKKERLPQPITQLIEMI